MFEAIVRLMTGRIPAEQVHKRETARGVLVVSMVLLGSAVIMLILPSLIGMLLGETAAPQTFWVGSHATLMGANILVVGLALFLVSRGNPLLAGHVLILSTWLITALLTVWFGASSLFAVLYLPVIASAAVVFGPRGGMGYALLVIVAFVGALVGEWAALWSPAFHAGLNLQLTAPLFVLVSLCSSALLMLYFARRLVLAQALVQEQAGRLRRARDAIVARDQQRQVERDRRHAAEHLLSIGQALSSTLDLEEMLNLILDKLRGLVPYDNACVLLLDESRQYMGLQALWGDTRTELVESQQFELQSFPLFDELITNNHPMVVNNIANDPRWVTFHGAADATRSWLGVPLVARDEVIGALSIGRLQAHDFEADDVTVAQVFAGQVAAAVQNARLYHSVTQQAEALEIAYEQLKIMERQRTDYYSVIVHDLRAPLTIATGYIELLEEDSQGDALTDEQRMMLSGIRRASDRMLTLVNDFLDYSKIEAGFLTIDPRTVDLVELIRLEVEALRSLAGSNHQRLTWIPPLDSVFVNVDPQRIRQVINNLVINAIKYTPSGGQIEVRLHDNAQEVCVEVQDNGPGVPTEVQPNLFEAYRQMTVTGGPRRIKGTGLGLFIVKHLVEAHGGQVGVESSGIAGEGSVFWFSLPLEDTFGDTASEPYQT